MRAQVLQTLPKLLRRSAAQSVGRPMCSVPELEVKNIGRWKSVIEFAKYMAVGAARRKKLEKDTGVDPIFSTWVCRPAIGRL